MFYSHHLLARKAPMGQIWMAATLHAKINRRKLDKLNIIKICEEILNPSVPMALRLSGILMGGVVIVYERKVKLLYDDVTRLLVEINEAWKVKPVKDPTILPKGRSKAKKEVITLPEKQDTDIGDYDQSLRYSNATTVTGFQQTTYFAMRLDDFDEICTDNPGEELREQAHQADAADITLCERFDLYQSNGDMYNGFERFDIEGDEETQVNFTSMENMQIPSTLVPSPTLEKEITRGAHMISGSIAPVDVEERKQKVHAYSQSDIAKEEFQLRKNQCELGAANAAKRKTRRSILIDNEQTFLPGHVYQSWLQDTSNIISSRGKKRKHRHIISTMKVARLMDLPPVVVCNGLIDEANGHVHYPTPLLNHLMKSMQLPLDSPSGRTSHVPPPEPSLSSPLDRNPSYQGPVNVPYAGGLGSQSHDHSIEKQRANLDQNDIPAEIFMDELNTNIMSNGIGVTEGNLLFTPGNSAADELRSIPSSGSGHGFSSHNIEANLGPSNKKRPRSASKHNSGGLEPVAEENTLHYPHPYFELSQLSENGSAPEQEFLVETGPTQTQPLHSVTNPFIDKIADTIRTQMKSHFDTPGAPQIESLNNLAYGMDRKRAAVLFYQTCVLATHQILKVEQNVPYGDISIARGTKM